MKDRSLITCFLTFGFWGKEQVLSSQKAQVQLRSRVIDVKVQVQLKVSLHFIRNVARGEDRENTGMMSENQTGA